MNYLKLKQKIYEAIERNPLDRSAYEEMFQPVMQDEPKIRTWIRNESVSV